jgi:two-component system LytT family response regulator
MTLRAIVVDDEPLARRGISVRLARAGDVQVVRECTSGRTAVRGILELEPDLVFLDVQMPGMDGFAVIEEIGAESMPVTVFVTAHDEHALRAFDAQALDYLLKPIDDERFARALERARRRVLERQQQARAEHVTALLSATGHGHPKDPSPGSRLVIRSGGRVVLLEAADIDWIEADGDYVRIHAGAQRHLVRETMRAVERRLDATQFVRLHRSTIVNVSRIRELRPLTGREWQVVLLGGATLQLSRRYRGRLEATLGRRL